MSDNSPPDDKPNAVDVVPDRRRPGRVAYTNRLLISMLRGEYPDQAARDTQEAAGDAGAPINASDQRRNDLAPAVGVLVSIMLSLPFWAIIVLIVWLIT
jgi:hypothetical protein